MNAVTRIRQIGNSDGLTFRAEQLREAGFARGDELAVQVSKGRITLVPAESDHTEAMDALAFCVARYDAALRRLAR